VPLLACTQNTQVLGSASRARHAYSITTCDFLSDGSVGAWRHCCPTSYPTPPSPTSPTHAPGSEARCHTSWRMGRCTKSRSRRKGMMAEGEGRGVVGVMRLAQITRCPLPGRLSRDLVPRLVTLKVFVIVPAVPVDLSTIICRRFCECRVVATLRHLTHGPIRSSTTRRCHVVTEPLKRLICAERYDHNTLLYLMRSFLKLGHPSYMAVMMSL
jgi:hypothetical protein